MKTLSLVTTICLPLSLIAGWYGMNFTAMPEVRGRFGYLFGIVLSAAVVSRVIVLLKRKKGQSLLVRLCFLNFSLTSGTL